MAKEPKFREIPGVPLNLSMGVGELQRLLKKDTQAPLLEKRWAYEELGTGLCIDTDFDGMFVDKLPSRRYLRVYLYARTTSGTMYLTLNLDNVANTEDSLHAWTYVTDGDIASSGVATYGSQDFEMYLHEPSANATTVFGVIDIINFSDQEKLVSWQLTDANGIGAVAFQNPLASIGSGQFAYTSGPVDKITIYSSGSGSLTGDSKITVLASNLETDF